MALVTDPVENATIPTINAASVKRIAVNATGEISCATMEPNEKDHAIRIEKHSIARWLWNLRVIDAFHKLNSI